MNFDRDAALRAKRCFLVAATVWAGLSSGCELYDRELLPERDAGVEDVDPAARPQPDPRQAGARTDSGSPGSNPNVAAPVPTPDAGRAPPVRACGQGKVMNAAGLCACEQDEDGGVDGACNEAPTPRHHYRFGGTGTTLRDEAGDADGIITATELDGSDGLTLAGNMQDAYASLPEGILSSLEATTIELWITWRGNDPGQHALSFGTAEPARPDGGCDGDPRYQGGTWYQACREPAAWDTAREECEAAGGCLLSIEATEEQMLAETMAASTDGLWIAANDRQAEGSWHWATRTGLSGDGPFWMGAVDGDAPAGSYVNWRRTDPVQPDNKDDEDCGFVRTDGSWADRPCEDTLAFACEWRGHRGERMASGLWFSPADGRYELPTLGLETAAGPVQAHARTPFPIGIETHVALVLDSSQGQARLYIAGVEAASVAADVRLSDLRDADNWLGRSHVASAPGFAGTLHELRIHDRALAPDELATN